MGDNERLVDDRSIDERLMYACCSGNIDEIDHLIMAGADVNCAESDIGSIGHAIHFRQLEVVRFLLENSADPNFKDRGGCTPLLHACGLLDNQSVEPGPEAYIELLVNHGANVNAKSTSGITPLISISRYRTTDAALFLIEHCADVNMSDAHHMTPLHYAVIHNRTDTTRLLIERGADINLVCGGKTTYDYPSACIHEILLVHDKLPEWQVDSINKSTCKNTPLHLACYEGALGSVEVLLEHGANANCINYHLMTPLHYACIGVHGRTTYHREGFGERDHIGIIRLLIEHGADTDMCNSSGYTPMECSVENGCDKTLLAMISEGAEISDRLEEIYYRGIGNANTKKIVDAIPEFKIWRSISETVISSQMEYNEKSSLYYLGVCISDILNLMVPIAL